MCKSKCIDTDLNCKSLCNKPLIDIERHNFNLMKRMTKVIKYDYTFIYLYIYILIYLY